MNRNPHAKTRRPVRNKLRTRRAGTCKPTRKARYDDQGAAYGAALELSRTLGPLRPYRCPDCHGWHLTRLPQWKDPT